MPSKIQRTPLGTLSQTYVGTAFTLAMLFTAMMSAFAANLSAAATSSRLLFALARDGFGPACFAKMSDKNHQPRNALTLILILSLLVDVVAWLSGKPAMGTGNSAIDAYFILRSSARLPDGCLSDDRDWSD
jgi:amino acid transporter